MAGTGMTSPAYVRPFAATLAPRELDILRAISTGAPHKEVAAAEGITVQTVKNHVTSIMRKLRARSALHAVALMDDYRPGWRRQLALPAHPVDIPAAVASGFAPRETGPSRVSA